MVHLLVLADGLTARYAIYSPDTHGEEISGREAQARNAARALGIHPPVFVGLPDNRCDTIPILDIAKVIEGVIDKIKPEVIYTHHANDLNVDHCLVHQAVLIACRPVPGAVVRSIYSFETLSSTEWEPIGSATMFQPTRFVDISAHLEAKRAAIAAYSNEMRAFPHPRSPEAIEALWRMRGAQSGLLAAEAFVVIREIC
jgi:LmbE family N-acetylglucosaminyl deacetylase